MDFVGKPLPNTKEEEEGQADAVFRLASARLVPILKILRLMPQVLLREDALCQILPAFTATSSNKVLCVDRWCKFEHLRHELLP